MPEVNASCRCGASMRAVDSSHHVSYHARDFYVAHAKCLTIVPVAEPPQQGDVQQRREDALDTRPGAFTPDLGHGGHGHSISAGGEQ